RQKHRQTTFPILLNSCEFNIADAGGFQSHLLLQTPTLKLAQVFTYDKVYRSRVRLKHGRSDLSAESQVLFVVAEIEVHVVALDVDDVVNIRVVNNAPL